MVIQRILTGGPGDLTQRPKSSARALTGACSKCHAVRPGPIARTAGAAAGNRPQASQEPRARAYRRHWSDAAIGAT
jgi:hypothetical protein